MLARLLLLAVLRIPFDNLGLHGYLDEHGATVIPPIYRNAGPFSDGLAPVQDDASKKWGYIDPKGAVVIPPQFGEAWAFHHGLGPAQGSTGEWGLVDRAGKVVSPLYTVILGRPDADGYWTAADAGGAIKILDAKGQPMPDGFVPPSSRGLHAIVAEGKIGLADANGKIVVAPRWRQDDFAFLEGLAAVTEGGRCGFVDRTGKLAVPEIYDACEDFHEGLAAVRRGAKWGYVARNGTLAIPAKYDVARDFAGGRVVVGVGRDLYAIDARGRSILKTPFRALAFDDEVGVFHATAAGQELGVDQILDAGGKPIGYERPAILPADLGEALRRLDVAYAGAQPAARARAVPHVSEAVRAFFFDRPADAFRELGLARLALASDRPPSPADVVAAMVVLRAPRTVPRGVPPYAVLCVPYTDHAVGAVHLEATFVDRLHGVRALIGQVGDGCIKIQERRVYGDSESYEVLVSANEQPPMRGVISVDDGTALPSLAAYEGKAPSIEMESMRHVEERLDDPTWRPAGLQTLPMLRAELDATIKRWAAGERGFAPTPGDHLLLAGGAELHLVVPENAPASAPLVIAIHGDGGDPSWWIDRYGDGALAREAKARGFYLLAIDLKVGVNGVADAVALARDLVPFDPKHVYLVGHSRGAMMALEAAAKDPAAYAGVAAISPGPDAVAMPPGVRVYVARGDHDLPAILKAAEATAASVKVPVHVVPDAEHYLVVGAAIGPALDFLMGKKL